MSPGIRALLLALVVVGVGLSAVFLEVETMQSAARTRDVLAEIDRRRETFRRCDADMLRALSPDLLAREAARVLEAAGEDTEGEAPEGADLGALAARNGRQ